MVDIGTGFFHLAAHEHTKPKFFEFVEDRITRLRKDVLSFNEIVHYAFQRDHDTHIVKSLVLMMTGFPGAAPAYYMAEQIASRDTAMHVAIGCSVAGVFGIAATIVSGSLLFRRPQNLTATAKPPEPNPQ